MRTIKFRGKGSVEGKGEWFYGSHVTDVFHIPTESDDDVIHFIQDGSLHLIEPTTLGQFTGCLDSYGHEIYEGDILCLRQDISSPNPDAVVFISYVYGTPVATDISKQPPSDQEVLLEYDESDGLLPLFFLLVDHSSGELCVEVSGNIHDNPELLTYIMKS